MNASFSRLILAVLAAWTGTCLAEGLDSFGNVDGLLTWRLGDLAAGQSARHVVLLVYDNSADAAARRLEQARTDFAALPEPAEPPAAPPPGKAWIRNDATDFALEGHCFFSWRGVKQCFACKYGGQISQFTYYLHYRDAAGEHRAGLRQEGDFLVENLRILQRPVALSQTEALGATETGDGKLRFRVRALMGKGSEVAVEFLITNTGKEALSDLRFSFYVNIEAAHTHENDFSQLDSRTGSLLVVDPPTGICVLMAGLTRPVRGYSGVWDSFPKLQAAEGAPIEQWKPFSGLTAETLRNARKQQSYSETYHLPYFVPNPTTPPTKDLSATEALSVLQKDWLFQAMGTPLLKRSESELSWARQLAERLAKTPQPPDFKEELSALDALESRLRQAAAAGADQADATELYYALRQVKRRILFKNPAVDFTQVLCIDQPYPGGPEWRHEATHRMGIHASPGGRLLLLDGLRPDAHVTQLAPDKPGSFWKPELSFDARRILFCYKAHDEKAFHLYEMNPDGTGQRQLTFGDYDDIDPLCLPDGHIMFTTTRGNSYVRCGPFIWSYTLARCNRDGSDIYLISQNGEPDFVPALLHDGRVIYSRWEYSDKPLWRLQKLWTTNQDGTGTALFWGNQSVWPDHPSQPQAIPGSRRIMFCGVAHHDWFSGSIGIIDHDSGFNFPSGLAKVTADLRWPECSPPPVDVHESPNYHRCGAFGGYMSPWPLSEKDFLVSARGSDNKFRLYLMDTDGNRELLYEGAHNIWHALPVRPRACPPVQPDRVVWPGTGKDRKPLENGLFFSSNVCEGVPELAPGSVKYLRVMQLDHKTYSTWAKAYRNSGPAISIVQEEGVKRVISIVPVAADGSVCFEAPPGRALFFQLLDEQYRCLQTMRSFTGLMPGEKRGCVGCHELHSVAPPSAAGVALLSVPTKVSPPPWGNESISYERFAQPVLDRYCGKCHQGDGKARKTLDLTLRPGVSVFKEPYLTLVGSAGWGNPVHNRGQAGYGIAGAIPVESMDPTLNDPKAYATLPPRRYLSYSSKLVEHAMSGKHNDVKADALSLQRLMTWVDACCPFMGEEEVRCQDDPQFAGIEELPIRPRVKTAPVVERP
ncbi:MAG: hypothetical protein ABSE73_07840 [Planctomycetota bacterium]